MPQGAFYVYSSVEGALGKEINGRVANTSSELADLILDEALVAVVPGEAFGTPGYIRLSYAVSDEDLVEGIRASKPCSPNRQGASKITTSCWHLLCQT